jgi:ABC-type Fe3+-hydroxamate transport system substrate-binding protein
VTVWHDDLGSPVELATPARRVVSLVPSLTEAVARSAPGLLVGATDWCTHPAGLAVTRVRGTKNPERAAIIALAPDLVIPTGKRTGSWTWTGCGTRAWPCG